MSITGDFASICNFFPARTPELSRLGLSILRDMVDGDGTATYRRYSEGDDALSILCVDDKVEMVAGGGDGCERYRITEAGRAAVEASASVRVSRSTRFARRLAEKNYCDGL